MLSDAATAASSSQQDGKKRKADKISSGQERWPEAKSGSSSSSSSRPASSSQPTGKKPRGGGRQPMPVEQYDLATDRTIARFDSHGDAARDTGINYSSISTCARGEYSHAGGFGWRTPGTASTRGAAAASGVGVTSKKQSSSSSMTTDEKPRHGGLPIKAVEQYDRTSGRVIAQFDSQAAAARATGIDPIDISHCLRRNYSDAGGFGWRRLEAAAGASAASRKVTTTTAATATTSGGIILSRFQQDDPFNIPFAKGNTT